MNFIRNISLPKTVHPQMTAAERIVMLVAVIVIVVAKTNELRFAAAGLFFGAVSILFKCARAHWLTQALTGIAVIAMLACAYILREM